MACSVYYFMLFYVITTCLAGSPSIDISLMDADSTDAEMPYFKLYKNKSFNFHITTDKSPSRIVCSDAKNNDAKFIEYEFQNQFVHGNKYTIPVKRALGKMETQWMCVLHLESGSTKHINFEVLRDFRIEGPNAVIRIKVNNRNIITYTTDIKETRFDLQGNYIYHEGELANITCQMIHGFTMHIAYNNSGDSDTESFLAATSQKKSQTVYMKLTDRHHASHVDCIVKTSNSPHSMYILRLYLEMDNKKDYPKLKVNDLVLAPIYDKSKKIYSFLYEFDDSEAITVRGLTKDVRECNKNNNKIDPQADGTIHVPITESHDTESIKCELEKQTVELQLKRLKNPFSLDKNYAKISGLSPAKTLLKYMEGETTYKIMYSNPVGQSIDLSCGIEKYCRWIFNDIEIKEDGRNITPLKDGALIKCECLINTATYTIVTQFVNKTVDTEPDTTTTVTTTTVTTTTVTTTTEYITTPTQHAITPLIQEYITTPTQHAITPLIQEYITTPTQHAITPLILDTNFDTTTDGVFGVARSVPLDPDSKQPTDNRTEVKTNESEYKKRPSDEDNKIVELSAISGVTVVVIILIISVIVSIQRRKRRLEGQAQASNVNYENFDNDRMSSPEQCNTYSTPADVAREEPTYSEPIRNGAPETLYSQPIPKSLRRAPNQYVDMGGPVEPAYAAVGQPGSTYDDRDVQQPTATYSQIMPKKLRDAAPQVLPTISNATYVQVLPKLSRNKLNEANYDNVFDNQRYANAKSDQKTEDYAEPAYCEVNNKRKK